MAAQNGVTFSSCQDVDSLFREARTYYNSYFIKKMAVNSIYYGRLETETWPLNSLPTQKAFRFGRGWYNPGNPWQEVQSGRCIQNADDVQFETIAHPGTESYSFSLFTKAMRTDWYQLTDFMYRLFPQEEMDHIMGTNVNITKNVHEEWARSQWIGGAGQHWMPISNGQSLVSTSIPTENAFIVQPFEGTNEGSYNMGYVYVNLPYSQINNIGLLSLDFLDNILIQLQREDDAYRLDVSEAAGRPLLEVIVPDSRVLRQLWQYAKQSGGWWESVSDFDDKQLQYSLGIDRVIGNYAFCNDINGVRLNVDWVYNSSLPTFNTNDWTTWPRLVRVLPYVPVTTELGCKYIQNIAYNYADFGITNPWVNKAMIKWISPSQSGIGEAQGMTQNYAGDWEWKNPDWECNIKRDQGFFWNQFRMGMQFQDPTLMHTILHRLNNTQLIVPAPNTLTPNYTPQYTPDCYACDSVITEPI